nr:hypothetical protein [Desulfobacula sp.]
MDTITAETIKEIAEQALSEKEGEFIMTLADKLRKEGEIRGLTEAIELGMVLRFPGQIAVVMAEVKKINSLDVLIKNQGRH